MHCLGNIMIEKFYEFIKKLSASNQNQTNTIIFDFSFIVEFPMFSKSDVLCFDRTKVETESIFAQRKKCNRHHGQ